VSSTALTLRALLARVFLLLPPCFAAWYFAAPYHAAVVGRIALGLVDQLRPSLVSALERSGATLTFVTTLPAALAPGQAGELVAEVNPLIYTYGLALFVALMFATRAKPWKTLAGAAILLPFQAWGIAFDLLAQVAVFFGPEISMRAGLSGGRAEAIALGYQVGSLIFPSLVPVLLWAWFCRAFIAGLRPQAPVAQGVLARELRPEEENLRRVVDPQQ
jgi:hypothetical protein